MTNFDDEKLKEIYERAEKEVFSVDRKDDRKFREAVDRLYKLPLKNTTKRRYISIPTHQLYHYLAEREGVHVDEHYRLSKDVLHKIIGEKKGKKDDAHSLTIDNVKDLSLYCADPLMIVKTVKDNQITLASVLDIKNSRGEHFESFIHIDKKGYQGKLFTNLASVYAKDNLSYWLKNDKDGTKKEIIYIDDKRITQESYHSMHVEVCTAVGAPVIRWQSISSSLISENILTRSELVNQKLINHLTFLTLGIQTELNSYEAKAFQKEHSKTPTNELLKEIHVKEKLRGRLPKMPKQQTNTLARTKAKSKDGIIQQ